MFDKISVSLPLFVIAARPISDRYSVLSGLSSLQRNSITFQTLIPILFLLHLLCGLPCDSAILTAKKLPKSDPQGGAGAGGRTRTGVDLQEATPQGRSGQCCSGGN